MISVRMGLRRLQGSSLGMREVATWERAPQLTTWVPEWVSETCDEFRLPGSYSRDIGAGAMDNG